MLISGREHRVCRVQHRRDRTVQSGRIDQRAAAEGDRGEPGESGGVVEGRTAAPPERDALAESRRGRPEVARIESDVTQVVERPAHQRIVAELAAVLQGLFDRCLARGWIARAPGDLADTVQGDRDRPPGLARSCATDGERLVDERTGFVVLSVDARQPAKAQERVGGEE